MSSLSFLSSAASHVAVIVVLKLYVTSSPIYWETSAHSGLFVTANRPRCGSCLPVPTARVPLCASVRWVAPGVTDIFKSRPHRAPLCTLSALFFFLWLGWVNCFLPLEDLIDHRSQRGTPKIPLNLQVFTPLSEVLTSTVCHYDCSVVVVLLKMLIMRVQIQHFWQHDAGRSCWCSFPTIVILILPNSGSILPTYTIVRGHCLSDAARVYLFRLDRRSATQPQ